jgi:Leucine-rich repeat (LRR) protein
MALASSAPSSLEQAIIMSVMQTNGRQVCLNNMKLQSVPEQIIEAYEDPAYLAKAINNTRTPPRASSTSIGSSLISLAQLQVIDLQYNDITHVTHRINEITSLVELNLANNLIQSLPPLAATSASSKSNPAIQPSSSSSSSSTTSNEQDEHSSKTVRVSGAVPTRHIESSCLANLVTLCLNDNKFSDFPIELCGLGITLRRLFLAHNDIAVIPPQISLFRVLEQLDLSSNRIQSLPEEFWSVTSLTWLQLDNNILSLLSPKIEHVCVQ